MGHQPAPFHSAQPRECTYLCFYCFKFAGVDLSIRDGGERSDVDHGASGNEGRRCAIDRRPLPCLKKQNSALGGEIARAVPTIGLKPDVQLVEESLVKNPVTKWMQPIVRREELARFKREFVSLHALSQERGDHFSRVKKALVAAGVKPVADPDLLGQTLYRRSDIP